MMQYSFIGAKYKEMYRVRVEIDNNKGLVIHIEYFDKTISFIQFVDKHHQFNENTMIALRKLLNKSDIQALEGIELPTTRIELDGLKAVYVRTIGEWIRTFIVYKYFTEARVFIGKEQDFVLINNENDLFANE